MPCNLDIVDEKIAAATTDRGAPPELKELADTLSVIDDVKHAFRAGVKAQKGVEW